MDLLNSCAIVAYVAGPIARFADRLRSDLLPGCPHETHITILPPRPLSCPSAEAVEFARQQVGKFEPFWVQVGSVAVFEDTRVVYLSLTSGVVELDSMHDVLNTGPFANDEEFPYSPHITLGKLLPPELFHQLQDQARSRWRQVIEPAPLRIDTVTVVQQRVDETWHNLADLGLGHVAAR